MGDTGICVNHEHGHRTTTDDIGQTALTLTPRDLLVLAFSDVLQGFHSANNFSIGVAQR